MPLEGCHNLRDLGGYPTRDGRRLRWRQLYRADALGRLTPADTQLLRESFGIRSVIDLRHAREQQRNGIAAIADGEAVRLLHLPLNRENVPDDDPVPDMDDLGTVYLWIARGVGPVLARTISAMAHDEAMPLIFHCAAGKDRTGIVAATLLDLLGVPDELIVADYALTELVAAGARPEDRAAAFTLYREQGAPPEALNARPEHMQRFLEGMRDLHGSLRDYLAPFGLSDAVVDRLRARLLE